LSIIEGNKTMRLSFGGLLLSAAVVLGTNYAQAQQRMPSISSLWRDTEFSQDECTDRARQAMRDNSYRRVELIGSTTFGDRGSYQIGIRCVTDRKLFYIFGGGPEERTVQRYIEELRDSMSR